MIRLRLAPSSATERDRRPVTDSEMFHQVLRAELMLPADADVTAAAYGRTETWDSVAHMQLVLALEEAFGISLSPDDVVEMSTYPAAVRVLRERHGVALAS
jgi:acyl carrier protein